MERQYALYIPTHFDKYLDRQIFVTYVVRFVRLTEMDAGESACLTQHTFIIYKENP